MRVHRVSNLVLAATFLSACQAEDSGPLTTGFAVRDSMGVRIVENFDSLWTGDEGWSVPSEPMLVIGTADGRVPGTDFGSISDITQLSDGRIAVADALSNEVRLFDSAGGLLLRLGGTGSGPGEFRRINQIGIIHGDTLAVEDLLGSGTSYFSSNGEFGRTESDPPRVWNDLRTMQVWGWLDDGTMVVTHSLLGPDAGETGLLSQEWHLFSASGDHIGHVATLPGRYDYTPGRASGSLELYPQSYTVVSPTGFWFAFSDEYELRHYRLEGVDRIVRRAWAREPVPDGARDALELRVERDLLRIWEVNPPDMRDRQLTQGRERIALMVLADSFPAFSAVILATDGHLWVRNHVQGESLACPEGEWDDVGVRTQCNSFSVFDPDGRWLGTVETPRGVQIFEIGDDYLLGVRRDDLEVQYVVRHEIVKVQR